MLWSFCSLNMQLQASNFHLDKLITLSMQTECSIAFNIDLKYNIIIDVITHNTVPTYPYGFFTSYCQAWNM